MNPDDPRHGKPRGYRVHREDDEDACVPCAEAWYRYNKRATYLRLTGQSLRVDAIGTHRRVRALMALGYGLPTIAAELGIATGNLSYKLQQPYVARTTHEAVADLFERLAMLPPPSGWIAQRTRDIATKRGWPPPGAWLNIDDPIEQPDPGYRPRRYTAAELTAEWDHLRLAGVSIHTAAGQLGVTVGAIEKACERAAKGSAA